MIVNKLIIGILMVASSIILNAQDSRSNLHLGAKAGVSYSNVYDSDGEEFDADAKFGFTGGGFLRIPIGSYLGIQPEVLITQKGFKGGGQLLGSRYDFKRTTTYLDIPLLVSIKPIESLTILAGPQYSYLLKEKYEFTSSATSFAQEEEFKQDNIRKNIFGIIGGVDIDLGQIVLSGRMGWDIQKNKGDGTSTTPRYKNVSSQVTIGFKLF
jgi:hypothetical protein